MLTSMPAVVQNVALITGILLLKVISEPAGAYYLSRLWTPEASLFSVALLSTSLIIGIVKATFGGDSGFMDQVQFPVVMIAIVLSSIIPILFALRFYPSPPKGAAE
jgi:fumarate reductase subunit C